MSATGGGINKLRLGGVIFFLSFCNTMLICHG